MSSSALAIASLWRRELLHFLRQPSRLLSAAATPLLFWVVIGTGLSASFRLPGAPGLDFREYFFPGTLALLVLFTSIFSTISVIEDRQSGFLQGVLVAPVAGGAIAAGKVLGGATLAWLEGVVFLAIAPLAGLPLSLGSALAAAGVVALLAVALTALGFAFAWRVDSTQGFHAVMNLLLVPMWLLSGAFFPVRGAPAWLEWLMQVNPLTYGVAALRRSLYAGGASLPADGLPAAGTSVLVLAAGCAAAFAADLVVVRGRRVA